MDEALSKAGDNGQAAADGASGYAAARQYWGEVRGDTVEQFGVAPIGDCGPLEVAYRHDRELRRLLKLAPLGKGARILELGSGNGRWILDLAPRASRYVAVDFSPPMLDIARRRVAAAGLANVEFHASAVQDFDTDQTFDLIYLSGVSQYLHDADLETAVRRFRSMLKPGGFLVDRSTVHREHRKVTDNADYFSIYRTSKEVRALFSRAGCDCVAQRPSYRFLRFPGVIRDLLQRPRITRWVAAAPWLSYPLLEFLATAYAMVRPPSPAAAEYSHEFAVFRAAAASSNA